MSISATLFLVAFVVILIFSRLMLSKFSADAQMHDDIHKHGLLGVLNQKATEQRPS